jgi:hypothetical protein
MLIPVFERKREPLFPGSYGFPACHNSFMTILRCRHRPIPLLLVLLVLQ